MAKRNTVQTTQGSKPVVKDEQSAPVPTRRSYVVAFWTTVVGLVLQLLMAVIGYGQLPAEIPSNWIGWIQPGGTIPSWVVFAAFPGAQLVVLIMAWFSGRDDEGQKVMDFGKAMSVVLLTLFFTVLQTSLFRIPR